MPRPKAFKFDEDSVRIHEEKRSLKVKVVALKSDEEDGSKEQMSRSESTFSNPKTPVTPGAALLREKFQMTPKSFKVTQIKERDTAIQELFKSEERYVEYLCNLHESYYIPLSKHGKGMLRKDFDLVMEFLKPVKILVDTHRTICKQLSLIWQEYDENESTVGPILQQLSQVFDIYVNYTALHDPVKQIFVQLSKSSNKFAKFLEFCRTRTNNQSWESLMLQPIQRIPRYHLIATRIMQKTNAFHVDSPYLTDAVRMLSQFTNSLNERVKKIERINLTKQMEKKYKPFMNGLAKEERGWILEGKLREPTGGKVTEHFAALCTDLLILTKYKKKEVGFDFLSIDWSFELSEVTQGHINSYRISKKDEANAFIVKSVDRSCILIAESKKKRKKWFDAIYERMDARTRVGSLKRYPVAPIPAPDTIRECNMCKTTFRMMQKHVHCEICGFPLCSDCCAYVVPKSLHEGRWKRGYVQLKTIPSFRKSCRPCYDNAFLPETAHEKIVLCSYYSRGDHLRTDAVDKLLQPIA